MARFIILHRHQLLFPTDRSPDRGLLEVAIETGTGFWIDGGTNTDGTIKARCRRTKLMRRLQQQMPLAARGIVIGSGRHIVTDTANSSRGAAAKGIAIRIEGHTGTGGNMADMLGMYPFTFNRLRSLAIAWCRRVGMTGSTVGADGISRGQCNSPGCIREIVRAAGVASFAVTSALIVVRTIAVHLDLTVTVRRKRIERFPVA